MSITLYSAANEVRELMAQMDPETGELPAEFGSALQVAKEKAGAVAAAIVSSRVQREAVEAHAKKLLAEVSKEEAREKRWIAYLLAGMQSASATQIIDSSGVTLVQRWPERDAVVDILDEKLIPEEYMRQPPIKVPPKEPNKNLMKADMKKGIDIQGGRLIFKDRIKVGI